MPYFFWVWRLRKSYFLVVQLAFKMLHTLIQLKSNYYLIS